MKNECPKNDKCKTAPSALPAVLTALGLLAGVFLLPLALWGYGAQPPAAAAPAPSAPPASPSPPPDPGADTLRLLLADGQVAELPLEDYVWGVVAAEMPAAFHPEALKAQAVAARTYALKRRRSAPHPGADLCADSHCCQAYRTRREALDAWGAEGPAYARKLDAAVAATRGQVLTYAGALIDAVYHASSAGQTADALAVWGAAQPYLVSVSTPETAETVPNFQTTVTFTPDQFAALVAQQYPAAALEGDPAGWFTGLERADWGGVTSLTVGGVPLTGGQVRALCSLRSTRFTLAADPDAITFTVTAYGHGVGMSQQGANLLARDGADYRAILTHYYTGATLVPDA